MSSRDKERTPRDPLDFYPTPSDVTAVLRDWLAKRDGAPEPIGPFLDPAAGAGDLVRAMRDGEPWCEAFWHAIEINRAHEDALEDVAEDVVIANAVHVEWPEAHVIMNPPFSQLDEFWKRASEHRERYGVWVACFTPIAWWHAEKRWHHVPPDFLLALGWRPSFRPKHGPAHKGSQDFAWSVLAPVAHARTEWQRVRRLEDFLQSTLFEFTRSA